ncbi:MAG: NAD(+) synthase [Candidatus Sumerlaeia bacterium]|nr:NAD(+) synthase [Candidatus Sumerlaeia bacterium]
MTLIIRAGVGTVNLTPLDWQGNKEKVLKVMGKAKEAGVSLLCLPEMCLTGYGCEDAFLAPHTADMAWRLLQEVLPATKGMVVSLGIPILHQHAFFNGAALVVDGRVVGLTAKRFLAGDGVHYEPRWFKPWPAGVRTEFRQGGACVPLGDLHYDVGGVKIGFEICEDAWVANRPGALLAAKGVDIILNPSASHFAFGKHDVRRRFVVEGSRAFGVGYLYSNLLGNEAGRMIYEGAGLIASGGELVKEGDRFSFADEELFFADLDVERERALHARVASFQPDLRDEPDLCVRIPFGWKQGQMNTLPAVKREKELEGFERKCEDFSHAVALGLFDYLRKSRAQGFVVSLSGGADSAAVALLCSLAMRFAVQSIGWEETKRKLAHLKGMDKFRNVSELIRGTLVCVYQGTSNSSEKTRRAARVVAEAVGGEFHEVEVETLRGEYVRLGEELEQRELTWEEDDIALQNIQARVRAPFVWLLANLRNFLLLSTSNRSEAAVGYATMDGDTAGGLCPIAGIDKQFLRRWLVWMEEVGPRGIGPTPGLSAVNALAPTAELRPLDQLQTDEEDLMPYDVLDAIEGFAIREKKSPLDVYLALRNLHPTVQSQQLCQWTCRFFRLWSRNQWKRERYAPSFHLDDKNLDPKSWCRFPILSGGYEWELAELENQVKEEGH